MRRHRKQVLSKAEPEKTKWTESLTDAFVDICVEFIESIPRSPGSPLPKFEWGGIASKFLSCTGTRYSNQALKNRWGQLRKEWGLWERMIQGETGLGWDHENQRVDMPNNWWDLKIQENIEFKKFKKNGYRYCDQLHPIFKGSLATGECCIAPSSGHNPVLIPTARDPSETDWLEQSADVYGPIPVSLQSLGVDHEPEKSTATSRVTKHDSTTPISGDFGSPLMTTSTGKQAAVSNKRKSSEPSTIAESLSRIARVMEVHYLRTVARQEAAAKAATTAVATTPAPGDAAMEIVNQMWDDEKLTMRQYIQAMKKLEKPYFRQVLIDMRPEARLALVIELAAS